MPEEAHRHYQYVGPRELLPTVDQPVYRGHIQTSDAIVTWLQEQRLSPRQGQAVTLTFIIDCQEQLWIADQHSEHVVCAAGQPVLAAGELTVEIIDKTSTVVAVTNQSTGYCPQPESWSAVARVLDRLKIDHPGGWTTAFLFRRCEQCAMTNIIKDGWFECAVCQAPLPNHWNYL